MELLSIQEKEAIGAKKDRALLSTDLQTLQETVKENRQTLQKRELAYKGLKEAYDNLLREKEEQEEQKRKEREEKERKRQEEREAKRLEEEQKRTQKKKEDEEKKKMEIR